MGDIMTKTFAFLTDRQHEVLAQLIAGEWPGYRTPALTRVLNNLKRVGMIDDHEKPTPDTRQRWAAWQEERL